MGVKNNYVDIRGQRFGKLTALQPTSERRHGHVVWLCQCDCGKQKVTTAHWLRTGGVKSCGCLLAGEVSRANSEAKGLRYKEISGKFWALVKKSAQVRSISFSLSKEEAWEVFEKQEGKCALSGVTLHFPARAKAVGTASLDRIDSRKTYTKDNIQWVHKDINCMKWDLTTTEFVNWCKLVAENNQ